MGKFVLDVKEWGMDSLMFYTQWDSLRKKCVVTDCKLEKHKLPLIDHKLSKTVESVESLDSRDSVDSVFATPGGVEIGALHAKIIMVLRTKIGFRIVSGDFGGEEREWDSFENKIGFHGMIGTSGTKMGKFYLISQSCTWR